MAMKIQIEKELLFFLDLQRFTQLLRVMYRRMQGLAGLEPLPIQVTSCKRTPIVSIYNSIDVEHRYYVELEMVF